VGVKLLMRDGGGEELSGIDKINRGQRNSVDLFHGDSGSLVGFCKIVAEPAQGILFFGHGW
jgi:hypothetical protein